MFTQEDFDKLRAAIRLTPQNEKRCGSKVLHQPHWYNDDSIWCDGHNREDKRP